MVSELWQLKAIYHNPETILFEIYIYIYIHIPINNMVASFKFFKTATQQKERPTWSTSQSRGLFLVFEGTALGQWHSSFVLFMGYPLSVHFESNQADWILSDFGLKIHVFFPSKLPYTQVMCALICRRPQKEGRRSISIHLGSEVEGMRFGYVEPVFHSWGMT